HWTRAPRPPIERREAPFSRIGRAAGGSTADRLVPAPACRSCGDGRRKGVTSSRISHSSGSCASVRTAFCSPRAAGRRDGAAPRVNAPGSTEGAMTVANKGYHPLLETDHPYVFVDSCMQIWPDADFANAHRHGVTAYAVTAWRPHATVEQALEEGMFWHLIARRHPDIVVAQTAADIRRAKRERQAAL